MRPLSHYEVLDVAVDLGWYVSTRHPDQALSVDFVQHDHDTWVEPAAGVRGTMLALVVPDVGAEHEADPEGYFLEETRALLGPHVPIVVSLDLLRYT